MVIAQHFRAYLDLVSVLVQTVVLVHLEYIEWDKWGIDPSVIIERTMYNLTPSLECSQLLIQE